MYLKLIESIQFSNILWSMASSVCISSYFYIFLRNISKLAVSEKKNQVIQYYFFFFLKIIPLEKFFIAIT